MFIIDYFPFLKYFKEPQERTKGRKTKGRTFLTLSYFFLQLCEAGNFSIHVALSDLRRNGKNCIIVFQFCAAIQYSFSYSASGKN